MLNVWLLSFWANHKIYSCQFIFGQVLSFADRDQEDRIDPMVYIFPRSPSLTLHKLPVVNSIKTRLTKCTFHKFGSSGELEKHDALCILPINIFNEKIYIFLWFWMLILGALTALVVVYRFALCISSSLRTYLFKLRYRK